MKDGGPAFPIPNDDRPGSYEAHPGMMLRDWFAGQALAGMTIPHDYATGPCNAVVVERCYVIADAMLKAREQSNG